MYGNLDTYSLIGLKNLLPDFYVFRENLFVYVVILYLAQYKWGRKPTDFVSELIMRGWIIFTLVITLLWRTQPPLNDLIGYWGWISPLQWSVFILISYRMILKKTGNPTLSFVTASLATNAGGYIYEIPYFIGDLVNGYKPFLQAILRANSNNPFVINSQVISIVLVILILKYELNFRCNRYMGLTGLLVLVAMNHSRWVSFYLVRLPIIFFFITVWMGIHSERA